MPICHFAYHFNFVDVWNAVMPFLCCWHHVMSRPVPMTYMNKKNHDAPYFDHLELWNTSLPLTMLSASHGANCITKCITWPKKSCCFSFHFSWLNKYNGAIDDSIGITWCWCWCQEHPITKSQVVSPFNHLDLISGMVPLMTLLVSCDTDTSINGI